MRDFARFGTIYAIKNVKNTHGIVLLFVRLPWKFTGSLTADVGVLHVFKIVQMIPNRAKYHKQSNAVHSPG